MARIRIEEKRLDAIIEYKNNPRHNDKAVGAVKESIKEFGFINPIIVNRAGEILAGHTRVKALKELGSESAACIVVDDLTEDQERAFRIADNRAADLSEWDSDLLVAEMKKAGEIDFSRFGFKDKELDRLRPPEECKCPRCGRSFFKV